MTSNPGITAQWRSSLLSAAALLAASLPLQAQTTGTATDQPAAPLPSQEVVKMSEFEVSTTQGHGYFSPNDATGFKTGERLLDIPQSEITVSRDFIDALGYEDATQLLQYIGAASFLQGEAFELRGARIAYPYVDGLPNNAFIQDSSIADSYEIIKGPTESLYLNSTLSGIVIKNLKKPLPFNQDVVTASVDQNGLFRATVDFTGPIGNLGDAKFSYRLVGVYQKGDTYFLNLPDDRKVIFPSFQTVYHNTTVRVNYFVEQFHGRSDGLDIATPTGHLYTGWGRDQAMDPPNNLDDYTTYWADITVLQKISDTWENKLVAGDNKYQRLGAIVLDTAGYDWQNQEMFLNHRRDFQRWNYWTVMDDTNGHFNFGSPNWEVKNTDTFGFAFSDWTNVSQYWVTAPFGDQAAGRALLPFQAAGTLAVKMNSPTPINSVVVPQLGAYSPPANIGSHLETILSAVYWQHSMDIIPNWLTISAAWTWDNIDTLSVTNESLLPWTPTQEPIHDWIYRYGAVFHATKNISLYALASTTFVPPTQGLLLENGLLPPPNDGKGTEVGAKWNFLGGRISGEGAWFRMTTTNVLSIAGTLPNGLTFAAPVGSTVQEGVDGDISVQISGGLQMIGTFYAGHDRDQAGNPLSTSYDNSWSLYANYTFDRVGPLGGLSAGLGMTRVGGRWVSTGGIFNYAPGLPADGEIKLATGNQMDGFLAYQLGKHWNFRVSCSNILNGTYVMGAEQIDVVDPSYPRDFTFQTSFKF